MRKAISLLLLFVMLLSQTITSTAETKSLKNLSKSDLLHLSSLNMTDFLQQIHEMGYSLEEMEKELATRYSFDIDGYTDVLLYTVYVHAYALLKDRGVFDIIDGKQTSAGTDDLSGCSISELAALKDRINLAMWESEEWQEVTVPDGIWKIGEDIPAGTWTVTVTGRSYLWVRYGDQLSQNGMDVSASSIGLLYQKNISGPDSIFHAEGDSSHINITLEEGYFFQVDGGSVIFTPYTGKPELGFK